MQIIVLVDTVEAFVSLDVGEVYSLGYMRCLCPSISSSVQSQVPSTFFTPAAQDAPPSLPFALHRPPPGAFRAPLLPSRCDVHQIPHHHRQAHPVLALLLL